ncbi:hypothetical protein [Ruegeria atlantica]|uniref:hypothetical protein n=1 Tax=Ruegeria atlantica TaxID=81569 RepID=UPI00147B8D1B|nr:hypothetical protein [Ruegeria atlantica]
MSYFKPLVSIKINADLKTYDVEAIVVVPTGCYASLGGELGVPDGYVTSPEAEPITLNIKSTDGPCVQGPQVLKFKLRWLPITIGKTSVVAFVTVDGKVRGVGSATIPNISVEATTVPTPSSGVDVTSVSAWINAQPPGKPTLVANVGVWAPCANYRYDFFDKGPFGITGRTRLVELKASLRDVCLRAVFVGPLRYELELESADDFDSLAIEFEGELFLDKLEVVV